MNRYVRTKDRVGKIAEPTEDCPIVEDEHWLGLTYGLIHKDTEPIIARANTLEELCDVVVETKGTTEEFKHYIYEGERFEKLKSKIIDDIRTQGFRVYFAIWTEWGLKYVAEMTREGDSILL